MVAPGIAFGLVLVGGWLYWRVTRRRARPRMPARLDHLRPARLGEANVTWYPRPPLARAAGTAEAADAAPAGPDDDPEFLRLLDWRIRNGLAE